MSRENVEVIRAAYEAWNAGETDALRELHDPDVMARYGADWPEPGPFVGREAVIRQIEQLRETWDANAAEPITDFVDAGDRVVARFLWRGLGHGPAFELEGSAVYTMRKGRIFGIEYFTDHAQALEAAGLTEQAMSQENLEIVRRWFVPLSASPEEVLAAVSEFWDAAGDYYPVPKWPEARPCHGREEVARFLVQFGEAFSRFDWAIRWLVAVGDDRVLVCANLRAEGRGSGINLEGDVYHCFWLRHGSFFRLEDHLTLSGAIHALGLEGETLEAAGLSLEDAHADF